MKVYPLDNRVAVKRIETPETTPSGLYLPERGRETPQEALVVAVGPGRLNDKGERLPMSVEPGDRVLVSKYGGVEIEVENEKLVILQDHEILAGLK